MTDARQLIDELTALGVKIELHDGKIKFGPKSKVTPELLLKMREERNQLIEFLEREPQAIAVAQNAGALNEQVAFSDVEFVPAFFLNHRYAGRGSIEVKSDTVIISAKRLWRSRGKQVAVILPVFIVFAFLGCILGLVPLLLVYTLVCRSFESDEIAIDRIKDATTKSRRKGQFRISPIEGEPMATVVFKANDASELIKGLQRNP